MSTKKPNPQEAKKKVLRKGRLDKERFGVEQVGRNIQQQHAMGGAVDRLVSDEAKLARDQSLSQGGSRQHQRWLERQQDKLAGRELRLRERDDKCRPARGQAESVRR